MNLSCVLTYFAPVLLQFALGLNFYVETHIDRISEDVAGFVRIMEKCPVYFEVNADISHYNYRCIKRGSALEKILSRVGHTHQRMAREHGDLSAGVSDPEQDWTDKGLTYQAFESMRPAFKNGLSSRCIVGESGPMHLVKDAIKLDASLVPLYRLMALACDAEVGLPLSQPLSSARTGGSGNNNSIADAERVLQAHFAIGESDGGHGGGANAAAGGEEAEAERILAQHFGTQKSAAAAAVSPRAAGDVLEAEKILAQHFSK